MPRPVKWRRVEFIPNIQYFVPTDKKPDDIEEVILKIEELEAMRLKDMQCLAQEECAKKMEVSRQTFQRILNDARGKVIDSLINGKVIRIDGGNFTRNICPVRCVNCGEVWNESYENFQKILNGEFECSVCGAKEIECAQNNYKKFCKCNCWRHGRNR